MKNTWLIFVRGLIGWSMFFSFPVCAVSGRYLDKSENPPFSCVVGFFNEEHIGAREIEIGGLCSGEFIGKNRFLTAAHCFEEKFDHGLISCSRMSESMYLAVTAVQLHPAYTRSGSPYDQAILTVERDVPFAPVKLPGNSNEIGRLLRKKDCVIFGHGLSHNDEILVLRGIPAEFNGALFEEGMVGIGGFSYPRPGDSGARLLCREDPDSPWIRIGTVSQAEIGLANAALLSPSLDWIQGQMETSPPAAGAADAVRFSATQNRGNAQEIPKNSIRPERSDKAVRQSAPGRRESVMEDYKRCVSRLQYAAGFDDSGYLKNNMEHIVALQCGDRPSRAFQFTDRPELPDKHFPPEDRDILFDEDSLMTENNLIQTVSEAYNFRKISPGENLCERTADNLFADGQSGSDSSVFILETKSGEKINFMVDVFTRCQLTVSYSHSHNCQGCGTRFWGRFNAVMSAVCDSIYVNDEKNLICEGEEARKVNLNYLRFLNRHKECFDSVAEYNPFHAHLSAERTFYKCIYSAVPEHPLSLCSLNQLIFADGAASLEFWTTDFEERYDKKKYHPNCVNVR